MLQTGSQQRTEMARQVPPRGRTRPRRPHRQDSEDRVPHRRQPDERGDQGRRAAEGTRLGHVARADREGAVPTRRRQDELPLRVPLVVRVLRRQDDRLGRTPHRHRPVDARRGRQRADRRRARRSRPSPTTRATATTATRGSRSCTPTPTASKVEVSHGAGSVANGMVDAKGDPSGGRDIIGRRERSARHRREGQDLRQPRDARGVRDVDPRSSRSPTTRCSTRRGRPTTWATSSTA